MGSCPRSAPASRSGAGTSVPTRDRPTGPAPSGTCSSTLGPVAHNDDDGAAPIPRPQDEEQAPAGEPADPDRGPSAPRFSRWSRLPRLDSLVPDQLADRGRAALSRLDDARAGITDARETVRDATRRLRAPGALVGPPRPAVGVPRAPESPLHRSQSGTAALLPRALEVPAPRARGSVAPLGWTGDIYLIGDDTPFAFVRRLPAKPVSKGKLAWGIVDELVTDTSVAGEDLRVVELLDLEGQVLLRSTPGWRRRDEGGWSVRDVTLADGSPVAEIVKPQRRARVGELVPVGAVRAATASTDPRDLDPSLPTAARVWRGPDELASIRTEGTNRSLTIGDLDGDDDALLVWAGVLSWWGGGLV